MVIEEFRNIRIAYMRRTGEYGIKNKELMETFKAYLRDKNLLSVDSTILGIALDDPGSIDKNSLRYDVGLVVTGNENIGLDVRKIPDGRYAVFEIPHTAEDLIQQRLYQNSGIIFHPCLVSCQSIGQSRLLNAIMQQRFQITYVNSAYQSTIGGDCILYNRKHLTTDSLCYIFLS